MEQGSNLQYPATALNGLGRSDLCHLGRLVRGKVPVGPNRVKRDNLHSGRDLAYRRDVTARLDFNDMGQPSPAIAGNFAAYLGERPGTVGQGIAIQDEAKGEASFLSAHCGNP